MLVPVVQTSLFTLLLISAKYTGLGLDTQKMGVSSSVVTGAKPYNSSLSRAIIMSRHYLQSNNGKVGSHLFAITQLTPT